MPAITNLKFPRLISKDLGFQVNRIKQYCMEQRKFEIVTNLTKYTNGYSKVYFKNSCHAYDTPLIFQTVKKCEKKEKLYVFGKDEQTIHRANKLFNFKTYLNVFGLNTSAEHGSNGGSEWLKLPHCGGQSKSLKVLSMHIIIAETQ